MKNIEMKTFQYLYDLATTCLSEGQKQVLLGELLLKIISPESTEEDGLRFLIKRDDSDEVRRCREEGRIMRRRFLPPDEIRLTVCANRKIIEVDVTNEEDGKIDRFKFGMSEPLKRIKAVFPNAYVSYIVDRLLSYDEE